MSTHNSVLVFFYGTLKRGHYNHTRFGLHDPTVGEVVEENAVVQGYGIDTSTGLPRAVRDDKMHMVGNLYMLRDLETFEVIAHMERGAGYTMKCVQVDTPSGPYECLMFPDNGVNASRYNLVHKYHG